MNECILYHHQSSSGHHHHIIDKKNTEEWLRTQCQDDYFYHKLAYHSTLCEEVANNAKISPVLYAISESAAQMKMCGLYDCTSLLAMISAGGFPVLICIFLVYVLTPSFLLPVMRSEFDRRREAAFLQQCSPHVRSHPLDAARANADTGRIKMV